VRILCALSMLFWRFHLQFIFLHFFLKSYWVFADWIPCEENKANRGFLMTRCIQYYKAADSEFASTVPHAESRILRPLVFRTQRLLLFERSYNTRPQSTAHDYPNAIKNNRMRYYGLQINYPINICVPCIMHVPKKLIVSDGRDTITD